MAKNIVTRAFSGAIYVALIVGCILGGGIWVQCLAALFALLAGIELTKITLGLSPHRLPALLLDLAALLVLSYGPSLVLVPFWIGLMLLRGVVQLYLKEENPLKSLALSCGLQVYIGLPCWLMAFFAQDTAQPMLLLAIFALIWINDTGAYLVGCSIGRHKMIPRLSPKKSWEGFLGGLFLAVAASVAFALCFNGFFNDFGNVAVWIGLAVVTVTFSTWGDLLESMIKRTLQIKDSGNMIPGHGGILDRIDSFLLVMPAVGVYYYFLI